LTANDSALTASDDISVTVTGGNQTSLQFESIEFARGSLVRTLGDLVAVRALLPHHEIGITVDAWQLHWGPSTLSELAAVPSAAVYSVQLDDAPAERPDDFGRATYEGRLVPGEGAADLTGLLRTLDQIGYDGPITVEAINAGLIAATDPCDLAVRLGDATRAVIAQSRG
jgi:sugar phosphate isomerase/epimerase